MDYLQSLALAIVIFACVMPLERGNMIKNEVTPAPTNDLSELFGPKEESEYDLVAPVKVVTADDVELMIEEAKIDVPVIEELNKNEPNPPKTAIKNNKSFLRQPVCPYGVSEIFLFGMSVTSIEEQPGVEVATVATSEINETDDSGKQDNDEVTVQETNITEKSTVHSDDNDENMKLELDNMHSFEEWKNLKLQEQESKKAEKEPSPPVHNVRAKKTQVNYASQDCGAKVLSHNKEAKHTSAILDENRDLYMLNPCSTSIWFVIELCEPIQVEQLQLGNLELFSSAPKEFTVSVSERYPAREWHTLGTFHATNDRYLQTFVPEAKPQMFAKYIKFDMLSHFSNEHFCPLTLVRVLGVSMVDEFDDSEHTGGSKDDIHDESRKDTSQTDEVNKEDDNPINTVFNMVKTAVDHVLNNGAESKNDDTGTKNTEKLPDINDTDPIDPTVESEIVLVTNDTEIAAPKDNKTQSFITLIETGHGEDISEFLKNNLRTCAARKIPLCVPKFLRYLSPISQKLNANMCWFLEFFCKVSLTSCLIHYPYNYSAIGFFIPLSGLGKYFSIEQKNVTGSDTVKNMDENITIPQTDTINEESTKSVSSEIPNSVTGTDKSKIVEDNKIGSNKNRPLNVEDEKISDAANKQIDKVPQLDHGDKEEIIKDGNGKSNNMVKDRTDVDNSGDKAVTLQDVEHINDKAINNVGIHEVDTITEVATQQADDESTNPTVTTTKQNITNEKLSAENIQISSENKTIANKTTNAVENTTKSTVQNTSADNYSNQQPPIVINPGTNQKDSVFMRLSNRIRVLEQNMSLSSDYLETLSRSYKKQMDEMQRAFNQTTSKLLSTSRTADVNDARQTELIHQAQVEIKVLTQQLQNLSLTHDQLNMQLVERHVCLVIFEIIVLVAVFVTCLGRRMCQMREDIHHAEEMVHDLQNLLANTKRYGNPLVPSKSNGHCASIPFNSSNQFPPPNGNPPTYTSKKHKARQKIVSDANKKAHRHKGHMKVSVRCDAMRDDPTIHGGPPYVEELGSKLEVGACGGKKSQNWNGHPISLKIPNGHAKGRK